MNAKTLKALKASIRHWERMKKKRDSLKESPKSSHCPLCQITDPYSCEGCPVYEKTRSENCLDTPWVTANKVFYHGTNKEWRIAAQKEIDFLKSLLP